MGCEYMHMCVLVNSRISQEQMQTKKKKKKKKKDEMSMRDEPRFPFVLFPLFVAQTLFCCARHVAYALTVLEEEERDR
jgi:hypothetical protein